MSESHGVPETDAIGMASLIEKYRDAILYRVVVNSDVAADDETPDEAAWASAEEQMARANLLAAVRSSSAQLTALRARLEAAERENATLRQRAEAVEADTERLASALVNCMVPYMALMSDKPSQKWIAPKIWSAMQSAVADGNAAIKAIDAARADAPTTEAQ